MLKFSAEDIANQSFEKSFRGYDPAQVEEFLQTIAREWEHLVGEFKRTREDLADRKDELDEYRNRERGLHDALEMAKKVAEEIKEKAQRDAELTVADAELEAERILSNVEDRVAELRQQIYSLKQQRKRYEAEMKSVIRSHMEMLEGMETPEIEPGEGVHRAPAASSTEPPEAPQSAATGSPTASPSRQEAQDCDPAPDDADDADGAESTGDAESTDGAVEVEEGDIESSANIGQSDTRDGPPIVSRN